MRYIYLTEKAALEKEKAFLPKFREKCFKTSSFFVHTDYSLQPI
jgi:hypothetical protein